MPTAAAFDALVSRLEAAGRRRLLGAVVRTVPHGRPGVRARSHDSNAGRYAVVKVNTDALPELGDRFAIRSIPTMAVFAEGREVARTAGARPAAEIEAFVRQASAAES